MFLLLAGSGTASAGTSLTVPIVTSGGGTPATLSCGSGEALVGLFGRAGWYVDAIGPRCAPVVGGAVAGAARSVDPLRGGPGGGAFVRDCPTGQVIVGLGGQSNDLVSRITLQCGVLAGTDRVSTAGARLADIGSVGGGTTFPVASCANAGLATGLVGEFDAAFVRKLQLACRDASGTAGTTPATTFSTSVTTPIVATTGGTPASLSCASGEALVGLFGRAGWYVDAIGPRCAPVVGGALAGAARSVDPLRGGPGGGAFVRDCPAGQVVTGLGGQGNDLVSKITLQCSVLAGTDRVSTAGTRLADIGSVGGGTTFPVASCTNSGLATGLVGEVDATFVRKLQLACRAVSETGGTTPGTDPGTGVGATPAPGGGTSPGTDPGTGGGTTPVPGGGTAPGTTPGTNPNPVTTSSTSVTTPIVTAAAGAPAALSCASGEALVGLFGRAGWYLDAIGPRCAPVVGGALTGAARSVDPLRGGPGGGAFVRDCPAGQVITGLGGQGSDLVSKITLQCSVLAGTDRVSTAGARLVDIGSVGGGTTFPVASCINSGFATGLVGEFDATFVRKLQLACRAVSEAGGTTPGTDPGTGGGATPAPGGGTSPGITPGTTPGTGTNPGTMPVTSVTAPIVATTGGTPATLSCGANEALVGLFGRAGWYVDAIGPRCAPMTAGSLTGAARSIDPLRGGPGGGAFVRDCPAGQVVTGLGGQGSALVSKITLQCSVLAGTDRVSTAGARLADIGSVGGGTTFPVASCASSGLATGLVGEFDATFVRKLQLACRAVSETGGTTPGTDPGTGGGTTPAPGGGTTPEAGGPLPAGDTPPEGDVLLINRRSGSCLSVPDAATASGTQLRQRTCIDGPADNWRFVAAGEGYQIRNTATGLCAAVIAAAANDGARLAQETCSTNTPSALWRVTKVDQWYRLSPLHAPRCMSPTGGNDNRDNDAPIVIWGCDDADPQRWTLSSAEAPAVWSPVTRLGLVPVSAATLPSGKLLLWASDQRTAFGGGSNQTYTTLFDPATNTSSERIVSTVGHDMFCPGISTLADGRILIAGGQTTQRTTIYNPANDTWSVGAQMSIGRGYNSLTTLSTGEAITVGGSWSGARGGKTAEVWSPVSQTWRRLDAIGGDVVAAPGVDVYRGDNYAWLFPVANGNVFHAGPSPQMNWLGTAGRGTVTPAGRRANDAFAMNGNAVMYDRDKILVMGGAPDQTDVPGRDSVHTIDIGRGFGVQPTVTRQTSMAFARAFANAVVLPSGEILVLGGQNLAREFTDERPVMIPELWSPKTKQFRRLPAMTIPRTYHSWATLMLDGRVGIGGGGLCNNCAFNHPDLQILTPPYLLDAAGRPASRPTISAITGEPQAGGTLTVQTDREVASFALVRLSSVTHATNTDQRRVPLEIGDRAGTSYQLALPEAATGQLLPGPWMLFAMDAAGVPSVAKIVRIP
ncbi:RICIN domain-containing protein [Aureimonas sp. AU12]|uniref:RICIN domain-containing protein n=1 Tax=Aureimonas sp. AU12 TaxID=1638161 RepID=UPI0012E3AC5B|nr:RICIN domain-containing protein [Aureimonas sp. AU12]